MDDLDEMDESKTDSGQRANGRLSTEHDVAEDTHPRANLANRVMRLEEAVGRLSDMDQERSRTALADQRDLDAYRQSLLTDQHKLREIEARLEGLESRWQLEAEEFECRYAIPPRLSRVEERIGEVTGEDVLAQLPIVARLEQLSALIEEMQAEVSAIDERQASQLAQIDATRSDISDDRHVAQLGLAQQYRSFVEQDLFSLARETAKYFAFEGPKREWIPRAIGVMCGQLFRLDADVRFQVTSERSRGVLARATELRSRALQSGLNCYWDYYFIPGEALDEDWQQPWGGCDATEPAKFLVAPAYVVGHRIYQRQYVFTGP